MSRSQAGGARSLALVLVALTALGEAQVSPGPGRTNAGAPVRGLVALLKALIEATQKPVSETAEGH